MHIRRHAMLVLSAIAALVPALAAAQAPARPTPNATPAASPSTQVLRPCESVTVDAPTSLALGKSRVVRLPFPAARMVVGGQATSRAGRAVPAAGTGGPGATGAPMAAIGGGGGGGGSESDGVADTEITLLSPTELFFLGRKAGSMNVVLQSNDGRCLVKDIIVSVDPARLQAQFDDLMPDEKGIQVRGAENALVLTGSVSDALKLEQVMSLAASYGDGRRVVNMLRVSAAQQVMLEVKIAEVSKSLLDRLGASTNVQRSASGGQNTYSLISNFLSGGGGLLQALRLGRGSITVDAQKDDGLVRVLAEPNIMAISGQAASFLSGGKIFIPVSQDSSSTGLPRITLEEKEFGVGLKFTPTVLDGNRINLKLVSEVSELAQTGSPFTSVNGFTAILPSLTTRRVDTTVQLIDGQSFVVAGLIKNNLTEAINRVPGLGEVPVVGALFRSTEFQADQTELMFVVTPRLVKPLTASVALPTDSHIAPNRNDVIFNGTGEGPEPSIAPSSTNP